jgi:para-aminobenzoate synthetase/4-amino-4-deoxychorismate lyase
MPGEGYRNLALHLERLADAADYFGYRFDRTAVDAALAAAASGFPATPRRVRLLVDATGRVEVTGTELVPLQGDYRIALAAAPLPVEQDPFVRHKTTHRVLYEAARRSMPGVDDVLLWNARGEITESTIANVVAELDGEWITPPVGSGLLPGIGRRVLLERGAVRERILHRADLPRCTRLALVNSLRGLWPVRLREPDPIAR